jgi:hypothetical protein
MTYCRTIVLTGIAALLLGVSIAAADPLEMKRPPSKPDKVAPSTPDRDLRPAQPPVPYRPGFLAPLTKDTRNGRVGAAGWTSPNLPAGSRGAAEPESSGVAGFGIAVERGRTPAREVDN